MTKPRVAIVDSRPVILRAMSNLLSMIGNLEVTGLGSSTSEAASVIAGGKCDVLILEVDDIRGALDAIAKVADNTVIPRVLVIADSPHVGDAVDAFERGASGYIFKNGPLDELITAIHAVARGETYIAQSVATQVVLALRRESTSKRRSGCATLSFREQQVLKLLVQGKKNKDIAIELMISERTVKHYMSLIMQKLQVQNRVEAILAAQRLQLDAFVRTPR